MQNVEIPKIFISYSWSSPDHEAWVIELAEEMSAAGIHVIFDKWDLREGQESTAFMEQMVSDPTVTKVLLICDKVYAEKADGRRGGVGTEAQIISSKIYQSASNTKFVAVVRERDDEGKAHLPTYYTSRIYIDLSDSANYASEFDRLIRWAYDQPLHVRPPIGKKPAYLERENKSITLVTSAEQRRAIEAIKADRTYADPAIEDYFTALSRGLEQFRIKKEGGTYFDDLMVDSIENFLPFRNEFIVLVSTIARYRDTIETRRNLHRFLESLLPYMERPSTVSQWSDSDFDNFRFIAHELFLYTIAALIKSEKFDFANDIISATYYIPGKSDYGRNSTVGFNAFMTYAESFETRNNRLDAKRTSLRADMLEQRSHSSGFSMQDLMQADFTLFLRDKIERANESFTWFPVTLVYLNRFSGAFEIFARSRSSRYFEKIKPILKIASKQQLHEYLSFLESDKGSLPRWNYNTLVPRPLTGYELLDTAP